MSQKRSRGRGTRTGEGKTFRPLSSTHWNPSNKRERLGVKGGAILSLFFFVGALTTLVHPYRSHGGVESTNAETRTHPTHVPWVLSGKKNELGTREGPPLTRVSPVLVVRPVPRTRGTGGRVRDECRGFPDSRRVLKGRQTNRLGPAPVSVSSRPGDPMDETRTPSRDVSSSLSSSSNISLLSDQVDPSSSNIKKY